MAYEPDEKTVDTIREELFLIAHEITDRPFDSARRVIQKLHELGWRPPENEGDK